MNLRNWDLKVVTSNPYHLSNSLAEIDIVKGMLKKCHKSRKDFELFLLNYRNALVASLKQSPAQLLCS